MTQKKMAERLGIDPKTIRNWRDTRPELLKILFLGLEAEKTNMKQSIIVGGKINNVDMSSHKNNFATQDNQCVHDMKNDNNNITNDLLNEISKNDSMIIDIVKMLQQLPEIKQRKIKLQVELELISEQEK